MKIGIVGHGSIGSRHARNARALGHEVLVYDLMGQKDVRFERNIYERCDAVVIATPTMYHQLALRACAERGKHVLIEKPMALVEDNLAELLALAAKNGTVVMMGNNLRFHPCVRRAEQYLVAGDIGVPIWAQFTCSQLGQKYIHDGVILNTGAHEVDLALHLFGPAEVLCASARTDDGGNDDITDFVLRHTDTNIRSSFHLDVITPNEIREAWIVGDKEKLGIEFRNRNTSLGAVAAGHGGSYDDDYFAEMQAFLERINGKETLGATGDDGLATLKLLLRVRAMAGLS